MPEKQISHICSMTGFARAEGNLVFDNGEHKWHWEIRSLNNRGFDLKCRIPSRFEGLEQAIRKKMAQKIGRGSVNVALQLQSKFSGTRLRLNEDVLNQVVAAAEKVRASMECTIPSVDGILTLKGVLDVDEAEPDAGNMEKLSAALLDTFEVALDGLHAARQAEGEKISAVIEAQIGEIESLSKRAEELAGVANQVTYNRLKKNLDELLGKVDLPEDRLAQEVAMIAVKSDVREETDRLHAHVAAATKMLEENGPVGRKFDFLAQEFNREANTLCSKASTIELKNIGLELKTVIDQMREQIQNIE